MNLYEINREMEAAFERAIDQDTGEINEDAMGLFRSLELQKEEKEENVALFIKNLKADLEAYKAEKKRFEDKIRSTNNRIEWLKRYLADSLNGEKLKTTRVSVYYSNNAYVELLPGFTEADIDKRYTKTEVTLDKAGITKALKAGEQIIGVELKKSESIVIK